MTIRMNKGKKGEMSKQTLKYYLSGFLDLSYALTILDIFMST